MRPEIGHAVYGGRHRRAAALAGALLGVAALGACGPDEPPPPDLRGTWTSAHPDYGGRALEIGTDSVRFHRGSEGGRRTAHPLLGTVERQDDRWTLRYGDRGRPYELRLRLEGDTVLVLENQAHVRWTRESGRPRSTP